VPSITCEARYVYDAGLAYGVVGREFGYELADAEGGELLRRHRRLYQSDSRADRRAGRIGQGECCGRDVERAAGRRRYDDDAVPLDPERGVLRGSCSREEPGKAGRIEADREAALGTADVDERAQRRRRESVRRGAVSDCPRPVDQAADAERGGARSRCCYPWRYRDRRYLQDWRQGLQACSEGGDVHDAARASGANADAGGIDHDRGICGREGRSEPRCQRGDACGIELVVES
jgi:hypothetical protein